MPFEFEKKKTRLPRSKDRRVKLSQEQREEIRNSVGVSQRELALAYGVSRRLISFILCPEKEAENKDRRAERGGWRQYYDRKKHAESIKSHRRYKNDVLKKEEE